MEILDNTGKCAPWRHWINMGYVSLDGMLHQDNQSYTTLGSYALHSCASRAKQCHSVCSSECCAFCGVGSLLFASWCSQD